MKIALVHDHLNQFGGAEKVLESFHELFPEAPIYTLIHDQQKLPNFLPQAKIIESFIARLPAGKKKFRWFLPLMPMAFERFDFSEFDVVLSSSSAFSKGIITRPGTIHICYMHSPTRYLWSDSSSYVKEQKASLLEKIVASSMLPFLRMWDLHAVQRIDSLIANSYYIQERINKYYHLPSTVIYPPVDIDKINLSTASGDYFLVMGRMRPYKRFDLAVAAATELNVPLWVVGSGEDEKRVKQLAGKNVKFLGTISEAAKFEILSKAKALLFPQEEDFGIVPVEAMAAGRPIIAYRRGGAVESVIEGKTGIFFDQQTVPALVAAIKNFENYNFNPVEIRQQAEKFSKTKFKQRILEAIEKSIVNYRSSNPATFGKIKI